MHGVASVGPQRPKNNSRVLHVWSPIHDHRRDWLSVFVRFRRLNHPQRERILLPLPAAAVLTARPGGGLGDRCVGAYADVRSCQSILFSFSMSLLFSLISIRGMEKYMDNTRADNAGEKPNWLLQWVVPEEDRWRYTSMPNNSVYRRFRSRNIVDLAAWAKEEGADSRGISRAMCAVMRRAPWVWEGLRRQEKRCKGLAAKRMVSVATATGRPRPINGAGTAGVSARGQAPPPNRVTLAETSPLSSQPPQARFGNQR